VAVDIGKFGPLDQPIDRSRAMALKLIGHDPSTSASSGIRVFSEPQRASRAVYLRYGRSRPVSQAMSTTTATTAAAIPMAITVYQSNGPSIVLV
jgi:hypothetical protein